MNISIARVASCVFLCAGVSSAGLGQTSAEAAYLRARRDAEQRFNAPRRPGESPQAQLEAHWAVMKDLEGRLREIIGPVDALGLADSVRINLETLYHEMDFGLLDGLRITSADKRTETVVTTRGIVSAWLAEGHATKGPRTVEAALRSTDVLADALHGDAMVLKYVDLPMADASRRGIISAMLMLRAQDYGDSPPKQVLVVVARGNRIFIIQSDAAVAIAQPPVCKARLDSAFKAETDSIMARRPALNGDSAAAAYRSCYAARLDRIPNIGKIIDQVNAIVAGVGNVPAQKPSAEPIGCYVSSPAMTYSASGEPEHGDSAWAFVRLDSGGVAYRPRLRAGGDRRSKWTLRQDTLEVLLFDGLVGWLSQFTPTAAGWSGTAQYLTDVSVKDQSPYRRQVTLTRRVCRPAP